MTENGRTCSAQKKNSNTIVIIFGKLVPTPV